MPRPILDALREKLVEYIKTIDINQIVALIISLITKKDGEEKSMAASPLLAELQELAEKAKENPDAEVDV